MPQELGTSDMALARHNPKVPGTPLTNRTLIRYAAPIFVFWVTLLLLVKFYRSELPRLEVLLWVLFLGSPFSIALGWRRFARHRSHHLQYDLKFGRNCLIAGAMSAAPLLLYVLAIFYIYFGLYGRR